MLLDYTLQEQYSDFVFALGGRGPVALDPTVNTPLAHSYHDSVQPRGESARRNDFGVRYPYDRKRGINQNAYKPISLTTNIGRSETARGGEGLEVSTHGIQVARDTCTLTVLTGGEVEGGIMPRG